MNQLLYDFLQALAQTTRFNFLPTDAEPAAPAPRWMHTLIRALMGLIYLLIAALLQRLLSQPVAAVVLAAIAILALHHWLTAGREAQLPRSLQLAWMPETVNPDSPGPLAIFLQCLPALLLLALLGLHAAAWLPAILALGAAGGRELARRTTPAATPKYDWWCWLVAAVTVFLTVICPSLANDAMRPFATRSALLVLLMTFLLMPWLRMLPRRPVGFQANSFLVSTIVTLMVLLIRCL